MRPAIALAAAAALAVAAGCGGAERREQGEAIEARRVAAGPGSATGTSTSTSPEADLAGPVRLEKVRDLAVRRNPDALAALERWSEALERVGVEWGLPDPAFRYTYSSMFRMHSYGLSQEIPFPSKLATAARAAAADARAMRWESRERDNAIRAQATGAYAQLWLARREVAIVDESLALLGRFVEVVRTRYAAGTATQPDLLRAEVERETLRAERADLARAVTAAASAMNALLDRPPDAPIGALEPLPAPPTRTAAAAAPVPGERPEVTAARERVAAADAMLSRARQGWIPDLMVGGAYVYDFGMSTDQVEVMAGASLPLAWGRISSEVAAAEAGTRRARAELRAAENRSRDEAAEAHARARAAAERFRILGEDALPRARQNVAASEAAYAAGQIDFLMLIDAQRMRLMRELDRERALAEHATAAAELERAVGVTPTGFEPVSRP